MVGLVDPPAQQLVEGCVSSQDDGLIRALDAPARQPSPGCQYTPGPRILQNARAYMWIFVSNAYSMISGCVCLAGGKLSGGFMVCEAGTGSLLMCSPWHLAACSTPSDVSQMPCISSSKADSRLLQDMGESCRELDECLMLRIGADRMFQHICRSPCCRVLVSCH